MIDGIDMNFLEVLLPLIDADLEQGLRSISSSSGDYHHIKIVTSDEAVLLHMTHYRSMIHISGKQDFETFDMTDPNSVEAILNYVKKTSDEYFRRRSASSKEYSIGKP